MPGPTGSGNDARKRRAAKIQLATLEVAAELLDLQRQAVALDRFFIADVQLAPADGSASARGIQAATSRLIMAARAFARASRDLERAYGMANPRRRARGEETLHPITLTLDEARARAGAEVWLRDAEGRVGE